MVRLSMHGVVCRTNTTTTPTRVEDLRAGCSSPMSVVVLPDLQSKVPCWPFVILLLLNAGGNHRVTACRMRVVWQLTASSVGRGRNPAPAAPCHPACAVPSLSCDDRSLSTFFFCSSYTSLPLLPLCQCIVVTCTSPTCFMWPYVRVCMQPSIQVVLT